MHASKDMLHEDLRVFHLPGRLAASLLSKGWVVRVLHKLEAGLSGRKIKGLDNQQLFIPANRGNREIRIRIFRPFKSKGILPGFLYLHGGGYMIGRPETSLENIRKFISARECVIIAPDYRKALDAPYPAAFDDCYQTLVWMKENAGMLGIHPQKFIIGGHSAGGGLAAAVSLKARDTGDVQIAFQMPIYPMIDDRQDTESAQDNDAPVWDSKTNQLGWQEYLMDLKRRNLEIPAYAAPSRAVDFTNLPATITIVGDLEPFRDETIRYVEALEKAGVPVAFRLFEGCFHGFEVIAPHTSVSREAWEFVLDSFSRYVDQHFGS